MDKTITPPKTNQQTMKHLLIILSIPLLSSILISCEMVFLLPEETYVGKRENSRYHGQGTLTFRDGDKYVGEFKEGKKHGQGTWTYYDGSKYVGEWKNNRKHGQGTWTYYDGGKYEGEFKDEKKDWSRNIHLV